MGPADAMLADLQDEIERRTALKDGLAQAAREAGRDMTDDEFELFTDATKSIDTALNKLGKIADGNRATIESRRKIAEINEQMAADKGQASRAPVEYRSVGAYVADMYYAQLGDVDAQQRMTMYNRVAAHQTTTDNPGLLPESIVSPLVNFVEVARPLVSTLGPTDLGSGAWSYARVTQHTSVAKQAGEKTELASRKMLITKTPLGADTFGGYVNVSKQDINRTSPAILDMVINDLAEQYAIETEEETASVLWTAATAGPIIPTGPATPSVVAGAIWAAAGQVFAATKGQGRTVVAVSPDMLGLIGPIFPPINPTNAYSSGFSLPLGQGDQGSIAGLTVIMSAGLQTGQILVYSTAAAKAFEYKYGNMQVVEPSVWGVQVGYAGDFDAVVIEPAGVVKVAKTP
jgi:HK97 family phage major capsid protein